MSTTGTSGDVDAYTVAQVAARMQVDRKTVYGWIHSGQLGKVRAGTSFRVPKTELARFLHEQLERSA